MTDVLDHDLRDGTALAKRPGVPARVLVWWGSEVLGSIDLDACLDAEAATVDVRRAFAVSARARALLPQSPRDDSTPVSLVICTRDRPALLATCLQAISELRLAPTEVLVVDNASASGDTKHVVEASGFRYLREDRPGLDHARNAGWRAARSPVVAYVDDDARVHPEHISALAQGFASPAVGAVTGLVVPAELETEAQQRFEDQGGMGKGYRPQLFHHTTWSWGVQPYRLGVGTNMAFRREVLDALGGFDVRLDVGTRTRGGGDLDLLLRVLLGRWAILYTPDAVVRHLHRRDWDDLVTQMTSNGVAMSALLAKYETEVPELAVAAAQERKAWRRQRHVLDVARCLAHRRTWEASLLRAEARGAAMGAEALALETAACR